MVSRHPARHHRLIRRNRWHDAIEGGGEMAARTNIRRVRGRGIVALGLAILLGAACGGRATPAALASDPTPTGAPTTAPATITPSPPITQPKAGTWRRLPAAPIAEPYIRTSVWTGTEMLILGRAFGGGSGTGTDQDIAAAYDPATDTWRVLPDGPDREGSYEGDNKAVWTGSEMLVWGINNKAYDPATDTWRRLPDPPVYWGSPAVAVWTGHQMIGWGGG